MTRRPGFTIAEVMIALAILATVTTSIAGGITALHGWQRTQKEQAQVQELAKALAERVLGEQWEWLGRDRPDDLSTSPPRVYRRNGWSWHRREWPAYPDPRTLNPPLTEGAADQANDLVAQGLVSGRTGLQDLKVYLEYYRMSALVDSLADPAAWTTQTRTLDDDVLGQAPTGDGATAMSLTQVRDAVVARIVVTWTGVAGGPRRHEVVLARRK